MDETARANFRLSHQGNYMDESRAASFEFIAEALERMLLATPGDAGEIYRSLRSSCESLHVDASDVLANVSHFVADSDVRDRDEDYRAMQERRMRDLINALRQGATREQLLAFSFLD